VGKDLKIGIGVALVIALLLFILTLARSGGKEVGPAVAQGPESVSTSQAEPGEESWTTLEELQLVPPQPIAAEEETEVVMVGVPPEPVAAELPPSREEPALAGPPGPVELAPPAYEPTPGPSIVEVSEVTVPQPQTYTVQKDENLWVLAKRYYGDGRQWKRIYEANRDILPSSSMVPVGTVLVIPAAESAFAEPLAPKLSVEQPVGPAPTPGVVTYTVETDDTLYGIARKYYGNASLWRMIYEANRDQISDPNRVRVGTVLVIPPGPGEGR